MNIILGCFLMAFAEIALPSWEFADTEVSTNIVRWFPAKTSGTFAFGVSFDGTASNNVEIAFGDDVDADLVLSPDEMQFALGWDCGAWFYCAGDGDIQIEKSSNDALTRKALGCSFVIRSDGIIRDAVITNGVESIFTNLTANHPRIRFNPNWNIVRFTARGVISPQSFFRVRWHPRGFYLIFR